MYLGHIGTHKESENLSIPLFLASPEINFFEICITAQKSLHQP